MEKSNRITYTTISQYLQGKLDEKAMHELERQALEDPFLAEAIEGFSTREHSAGHLSILQRQLEERIALQAEKKNAYFFNWQRISVAAAACLLFISASILFWMKGSMRTERSGREKQVEVELRPSQNPTASRADQAKATSALAEPVGGWANYKKYILEQQHRSSNIQGAKVNVLFSVGSRGEPRDFVVGKEFPEQLRKEAIRIIKEGPRWKPEGAENVQVTIEFKK